VGEVLDELDRELVGLAPVKTRLREIASLLSWTGRAALGVEAPTRAAHVLHGNPGTGKTTVATRCDDPAPLGHVRKGHLVASRATTSWPVHRPHGPRPRKCQARHGGVLFIDEAYYSTGRERARLRPGGHRDPEQVMETSATTSW